MITLNHASVAVTKSSLPKVKHLQSKETGLLSTAFGECLHWLAAVQPVTVGPLSCFFF